ncbi:MAG: M1 family aminopeptidase [candidate division Zixibacteria bacterium]
MKRLLVLILISGFLGAGVWSQESEIPGNSEKSPNDYTPAETHKWLWENELRPHLLKVKQVEKDRALMALSNWQEYDITFYSIDITIYYDIQSIDGVVGIHGRIQAGSLDSIVVDLRYNMDVDSIFNNSGNLEFTHNEDLLTVYLERDYFFDEEFKFTVVYHGEPLQMGGLQGFQFTERFGLPLITTLSQPFGSRDWWPCNDITTDKADSADIIITADTSLVISSNGLMVSDVDNGDGTHTAYWKERYPIVPYLVSLAMHPYSVWYDEYDYGVGVVPLHYYVFDDHVEDSKLYFAIMPNALAIFEDFFGEYPYRNEKYGCSHFDWGGAMEHQTNTSTQASQWAYSDNIITHELAHQWWGDEITCSDWHHIWINEGFASYSEALYHEVVYGKEYYHTYMDYMEFKGSGSIYIQDTVNIWSIFGRIVYDKGAWVLHMLRHIVGEELFFQSLNNYRQQYKWGSASTEDFQAVVETTCGIDLDYFFEQWIYGIYFPEYTIAPYSRSDPEGGYIHYLYVEQTQETDPLVFSMPIDVHLERTEATDTITVFNNRREQVFYFHTDEAVNSIELDPKKWILREVTQEFWGIRVFADSLSEASINGNYEDTISILSVNDAYTSEILSGSLPPGLEFDPETGIISGFPIEMGEYDFSIYAVDAYNSELQDTTEFTIIVTDAILDRPGDANDDGDVNVGDAVFLINLVFKSGPPPAKPNWADTNADCAINIGDAVYLINHVFRDGLAPQLGCVE